VVTVEPLTREVTNLAIAWLLDELFSRMLRSVDVAITSIWLMIRFIRSAFDMGGTDQPYESKAAYFHNRVAAIFYTYPELTPNRPVAQLVANQLPALGKRPQ
jgi:hypothetical protein